MQRRHWVHQSFVVIDQAFALALVVAVFKDKSEFLSYGPEPISLPQIFSTVFESLNSGLGPRIELNWKKICSWVLCTCSSRMLLV